MSARSECARVPVAILAGGLGTRLRAAIGDTPKPIADVAGRPFVAYLLDALAASGFREVVLCVGFRADAVERALGSTHGPLRLRYAREAVPLGTGGALRAALPLLEGDAALVLNGDSFCDADLGEFWRQHRAAGSQATLLLVEVPDAGRYGRVELDEDDAICAFREKQEPALPGWINAGVYALARSRIEAIPATTPLSLERDVFPGWVGHGLRGIRSRARFLDIGIPEAYDRAPAFFRALGRGSRA